MRSTNPTTDALRAYAPSIAALAGTTRQALCKARLRGLLEGMAIATAACVIAVAIGRAPVSDVEASAALDAEIARLPKPTEPCWDELPFRVALTQENIDRLCIKPLPMRSAVAAPVPVPPTTQKREYHATETQ